MGRNRFVQPDIVRVYLVAAQRQALADLLDPVKQQALAPDKRATPEDIRKAEAKVAQAQTDGDWIDIKKELNAGEHRRVFGRLVKDMRAGEKVLLDPEQVGLTKVVEYLLGWSFVDGAGKPVELSEGAINSLDQETYMDIMQAIDAHEKTVEAEREARKNATAETQKSSAISASHG